jgi:hypothetical protein
VQPSGARRPRRLGRRARRAAPLRRRLKLGPDGQTRRQAWICRSQRKATRRSAGAPVSASACRRQRWAARAAWSRVGASGVTGWRGSVAPCLVAVRDSKQRKGSLCHRLQSRHQLRRSEPGAIHPYPARTPPGTPRHTATSSAPLIAPACPAPHEILTLLSRGPQRRRPRSQS